MDDEPIIIIALDREDKRQTMIFKIEKDLVHFVFLLFFFFVSFFFFFFLVSCTLRESVVANLAPRIYR